MKTVSSQNRISQTSFYSTKIIRYITPECVSPAQNTINHSITVFVRIARNLNGFCAYFNLVFPAYTWYGVRILLSCSFKDKNVIINHFTHNSRSKTTDQNSTYQHNQTPVNVRDKHRCHDESEHSVHDCLIDNTT